MKALKKVGRPSSRAHPAMLAAVWCEVQNRIRLGAKNVSAACRQIADRRIAIVTPEQSKRQRLYDRNTIRRWYYEAEKLPEGSEAKQRMRRFEAAIRRH
jgi:hypothetical protein